MCSPRSSAGKKTSIERMEKVNQGQKYSPYKNECFYHSLKCSSNVPKGLRNGDQLLCFLTFSTNKYLLFSFRSNALLNAIYCMLGLGLTDEIRTYLASTRILQLPQIIGLQTEMKIFKIFCNVIHLWIPGLIWKESFRITIL